MLIIYILYFIFDVNRISLHAIAKINFLTLVWVTLYHKAILWACYIYYDFVESIFGTALACMVLTIF